MSKKKMLICPKCKENGVVTEFAENYKPGLPYLCPRFHYIIAPFDDKEKGESPSSTKRVYPRGTFVLSEQPCKIREEYLKAYKEGDQVLLECIVRKAMLLQEGEKKK